MTRRGIGGVAALVVLSGLPSAASAEPLQNRSWSNGTAWTVPQWRVEVGVFQPLRIGLLPNLEVSTHPLVMFLMPNLAVKVPWLREGGWQIASEHGLWYPSPLVRTLRRHGTGGIWPNDTQVPDILMLNTTLYASAEAGHQRVTAKASVQLAASIGPSTLQTLDLPLVYTRTAAWFNGVTFLAGIDLDGRVAGPFYYQTDVDLWMLTDEDASFSVEHSLLLTWQATANVQVQLGYKLVVGQYPYGIDWDILPMADLHFGFN
jgi:hypothetical protein